MSRELEKTFVKPEVDVALALLARNGDNIDRTSKMIGRAPATLRDWREKHRERYLEHAERIADAVEAAIVVDARDYALSVGETERLVLQRVHERAERDELNDPAGALLRLTTTKGINLTKLLELTGRDIKRIEYTDAAELLRVIRSKVYELDGEAHEIKASADTVSIHAQA